MIPDPNKPDHFVHLKEAKSLRKWLNVYLSDQTGIYEFDKNHACLAYPVRFLVETLNEFKAKSISCRHLQKNLKFVKEELFCDDKGCLTHLLRHFDNCD